MSVIKFKQISSLEKVMPDAFPGSEEYSYASILRGEEFSYQIAYWSYEKMFVRVSVESDLDVKLYDVEFIPSELPAYLNKCDEHYISTNPGMYPDLLIPFKNNEIVARPVCRSFSVIVYINSHSYPYIEIL